MGCLRGTRYWILDIGYCLSHFLFIMITVGAYNTVKVLRTVSFGVFLDDGDKGILLPKRFVPPGVKDGDAIKVFIYHDGEDRLIATTQSPKGIAGDVVKLKVISVTNQGA